MVKNFDARSRIVHRIRTYNQIVAVLISAPIVIVATWFMFGFAHSFRSEYIVLRVAVIFGTYVAIYYMVNIIYTIVLALCSQTVMRLFYKNELKKNNLL